MLSFSLARLKPLVLVGALAWAVACGTEVAQTALPGPSAPLDCKAPGALALPQDDTFGDGTEPASSLIGIGYEGEEGPGLFVTARDAFRVYLNGRLVVVSDKARKASFVPLTLLPGANALTVVVAAKAGTPVALLQLDDLEKSYVSDESWKVSTEPTGDFTSTAFDDSSWSAAKDYGALAALPGCGDDDALPVGSLAHWIGPTTGAGNVAVLRKVIRVQAVGFGASTTGGGDAVPQRVDTWDELAKLAQDPDAPAVILLSEGVHDFRDTERDQDVCPAVCTNDAGKSYYLVLSGSQTCSVALVTRPRRERLLDLGSNKTLVGLGRGAQLRGVTLAFSGNENVIVRNVALYDVNPEIIEAGDAFSFVKPSRVWLDHCTTKWISDGFTDASGGKDVTISWLHYDGVSPSACRGQHLRAMELNEATVTVHHTFFDHVESHSPRVDDATARVHLFGNLFSDNPGYAVASTCGAEVLLEGNTFQRVSTPTSRSTCADNTALGKIDAPTGSNHYGEDVGDHHGGDGLEPHDAVFEPAYPYELGNPEEDWLQVFSRAGAGGRWALPLSLE